MLCTGRIETPLCFRLGYSEDPQEGFVAPLRQFEEPWLDLCEQPLVGVVLVVPRAPPVLRYGLSTTDWSPPPALPR